MINSNTEMTKNTETNTHKIMGNLFAKERNKNFRFSPHRHWQMNVSV